MTIRDLVHLLIDIGPDSREVRVNGQPVTAVKVNPSTVEITTREGE